MKEKILIIDDMPFNIRLLKEVLEDEGYEVFSLGESSSMDILETICTIMPDTIFLDIMMPGINGFEMCRLIKSNISLRHIPVIMLSAMNDGQSISRAHELGAFGFISKPFEDEDITSLVKAALDSSKGQVQPGGQLCSAVRVSTVEHTLENNEGFDVRSIFNKLDEDAGFFVESILIFEKDSRDLLSAIKTSISVGDKEDWEQSVHALKGLVSYFNASSAEKLIAQIKSLLDNQEYLAADSIVNSLEKEIEKIIHSLKMFAHEVGLEF